MQYLIMYNNLLYNAFIYNALIFQQTQCVHEINNLVNAYYPLDHWAIIYCHKTALYVLPLRVSPDSAPVDALCVYDLNYLAAPIIPLDHYHIMR